MMENAADRTAVSEKRTAGSIRGKPPSEDQRPLWKGYLSLLIRAAVFVAVFALLFTKVLFLNRVSGSDMFPSLKDGDLALGFRLESEYRTGDVVRYEADGSFHFGRILALGGSTVNISGDGTVEINGVTESDEIFFPTEDPGSIAYPYQVPEGSVFILGDDRPDAKDSRTYGAVPLEKIEGKVLTILRRRGL